MVFLLFKAGEDYIQPSCLCLCVCVCTIGFSESIPHDVQVCMAHRTQRILKIGEDCWHCSLFFWRKQCEKDCEKKTVERVVEVIRGNWCRDT